jgi:hypothetical protein
MSEKPLAGGIIPLSHDMLFTRDSLLKAFWLLFSLEIVS